MTTYEQGFIDKCAACGIKLAAPGIGRSFSEAGLLKALADKLRRYPKAVNEASDLRRQLRNLETRPADIANDSWLLDSGKVRQELVDRLGRAEVRPDTSVWNNKVRYKALKPILERLAAERTRLSKLSPGQLSRSQYRKNSLQSLRGQSAASPEPGRILKMHNDNKYW